MRTGRPKQPIILSKAEEEQLKSISRSRSFSHGLVTRARIIIMSAEGTSNKDIARKLDYSVQPPVFGPPFKLVSGDAFSAPSAVLPKVQEVDNSELNVV